MWTSMHNPQVSLFKSSSWRLLLELKQLTNARLSLGFESFEHASSVSGSGGFSQEAQLAPGMPVFWPLGAGLSPESLLSACRTWNKIFWKPGHPQPLWPKVAKVRGPGPEGDMQEQATSHPVTSPFPGTSPALLSLSHIGYKAGKLRLSLIVCLEGDGDVWMSLVLSY